MAEIISAAILSPRHHLLLKYQQRNLLTANYPSDSEIYLSKNEGYFSKQENALKGNLFDLKTKNYKENCFESFKNLDSLKKIDK